ncbi:hypothetical protein BpHYR1_037502 [Brachionus plicatilis]|uniref:Uncharacterized protein n=1 Tax=Brachionus plicatilis TaxID=10195 RepID=A0A3M7PGX8_BRAPC|nr:hypothetical protein BpHYR1_037502 [Brachionus plicatilis]
MSLGAIEFNMNKFIALFQIYSGYVIRNLVVRYRFKLICIDINLKYTRSTLKGPQKFFDTFWIYCIIFINCLTPLNALRNTDDTQSIASDYDDADFLDDHYSLDEFDKVDGVVDEDYKERKRKFFLKKMKVNKDQNLDKTSKIGVVWTKLKNGEDLSLRKKFNFDEKPGPTSHATRNKAFMKIFDMSKLNLIEQCTNSTRILFNLIEPKICRVFCIVNLTPPVLRDIKNIALLSDN